jgi:two-component system, sensor histidine kinase and response regulator
MPPRVVANQPVFLSTAPGGPGDRRLALAVILVSLLIFLTLAPFAQVPLPRVFGFVPMYESAIAISDLVTVAILFIQYNILRSNALLALASGYLFTALMAICHSLTFPGLFAPGGLLGSGPQTTAWLYMFWHGGFPIAVIAYSLLREENNTADASAKSS